MIEGLLVLLIGIIGGLLFFAGLWYGVRIALRSPHPAIVLLTSFILRTGLIITMFYFASGSSWQKWVICVAGFLIGRTVVNQLIKRTGRSGTWTEKS